MTTTARAPSPFRGIAKHPEARGKVGEGVFPTCHICGAPVAPDRDPRRPGWLACAHCGPVYLPLQGRYIRLTLHGGLEAAQARNLQRDLRLLASR